MRKNGVLLPHRVGYIVFLALTLFVCVWSAGWIKTSSQASPAPTPNVQAVAVTNGIVFLNEGRAAAVFCSATANSGNPPTPTGKCSSMGTVGNSATGFTLTAVGIHAFINNKDTGAIFQCTTLISNGQPSGACKEIANLSSF